MTDQPLVTVVLATKDRPRTLPSAVGSALAQQDVDLELIVVDDGSNPPVVLSPEQRGDPRVMLIRLDQNRGIGAARNIGVAAGTGAVLAFLDDDDTWRPHKLRRQLDVLQRQPADVCGVECGFDFWDGSKHVWRVLPEPGVHDLSRPLLRHHCLVPTTFVLRRVAFDAVDGFDESLVRCEDWDLWVRLADRYQFAMLGEVHADRQHHAKDPSVELPAYRQLLDLLDPRIRRLPPTEQRQVRAFHSFQLGLRLAACGHSAQGRRLMLAAWRSDPRNLGWLVHAVATGQHPAARQLGRMLRSAAGGFRRLRAGGEVPLSKG